ncbi:unnamed protein product [Adineta ricciae]|uniref:Uncharacterized protein n=1 Tax=Adineta ricciae TaxID=249248 RepID=A0A816EXQ7_ADIRI|nr:unnamed protein product [Adineta ricciae]
MILCEATIDDVFDGLCHAVDRIQLGQIPDADHWHKKIKTWYSWRYVTENTEVVYNHIMTKEQINLKERIERYKQCGFVSSFIMSFVAILSYLIFLFLDYLQPRHLIDQCCEYSKEDFEKKLFSFKPMIHLRMLTLAHVNYHELRCLLTLKDFFFIIQQLKTFKIQSTSFNGLDRDRLVVLQKIFTQMPKLRVCQVPLIDVNDFDDLKPSACLEEFSLDYGTMACLGK